MVSGQYAATVDYLYSQLPMYQRDGKSAFKKDLNNTIQLCRLLGNPHKKLQSIHIAGTNGKGSTAHILASILQSQGYKVGLYTSPHYKDYRERIKINGSYISEKYVIEFVEKYKSDFGQIKPSFFEITVALAFDYFANQKVDYAIIETGLGGRLDSTNVITPILSVITNIGLDHQDLLGNTLQEIAAEKAGIIKPNIPVVIREQKQETQEVFQNKAKDQKSPLYWADSSSIKNISQSIIQEQQVFIIDDKEYVTDLLGSYQIKNISTSLKAIEVLKDIGIKISDDAISLGLNHVKSNTKLLGRCQVLSKEPLTIADAGHNEDGIKETIAQIKDIEYDKLHIVLGMVKDKDISGMLSLFPKNATYYFCQPNIPRGLDVIELKTKSSSFSLYGNAYKTVKEALEASRNCAKETDLIFIGGSSFVVAEVV